MLKAGNQEPVEDIFSECKVKAYTGRNDFKKIESDSASISQLLDSAAFVEKYGFNTDNVYTMFIPNSYEIYWNSNPEKFFPRMHMTNT